MTFSEHDLENEKLKELHNSAWSLLNAKCEEIKKITKDITGWKNQSAFFEKAVKDCEERIEQLKLSVEIEKAWNERFLLRLKDSIEEIKNYYPKDIFRWDNKEKLSFNRGRYNEFIHKEIENFRKDVLDIIGELRTHSGNLGKLGESREKEKGEKTMAVKNKRFGCNMCKQNVATFRFEGQYYSGYDLWICKPCLTKLLKCGKKGIIWNVGGFGWCCVQHWKQKKSLMGRLICFLVR